MRTSDNISDLSAALAKAQGEFLPIEKNRTGKVQTSKANFSYDYADLSDVMQAIRPALSKNGLAISHDATVELEPTLCVLVTARLEHASGQWKESSPLRIPCEGFMGQAQLIGSADTYGRRYTTCSITGVVAQSDDDGTGAAGVDAETGSRQREVLPECPSCGKQTSVIVGKQEFGGGLVCFKKKDGCGHTWGTAEHPIVEKDEQPKANGKSKATKPLTTGKDPNGAASPYSTAMSKILNFHGKPEEFATFRNQVLQWFDDKPDDTSADQKKLIEKALTAREDELNALPV